MLRVFGRRAVLEALLDPAVEVLEVLLDRSARGEGVAAIEAAAHDRRVPVRKVSGAKVTRVSGNGRHDQGVVAEVAAPGLVELASWLAEHGVGPVAVLLLDGITNPANVGMIVRTATAAGLDGVVLPRAGSPELGPLVVKASAGTAYRARVLTAPSAATAAADLVAAGITTVGLRAGADTGLFEAPLPARAAFVLGGETTGVSVPCQEWRSIPLAGGVESLNVAVAAALVAYEVARRR